MRRFYENGYCLKKAAVDGDNSIARELERIHKICIDRSCPRAHTDRSQGKEGTPYQGQWCLRRRHCYICDHDWHPSKVMFSIAVKTICAPGVDDAQSMDLLLVFALVRSPALCTTMMTSDNSFFVPLQLLLRWRTMRRTGKNQR